MSRAHRAEPYRIGQISVISSVGKFKYMYYIHFNVYVNYRTLIHGSSTYTRPNPYPWATGTDLDGYG